MLLKHMKPAYYRMKYNLTLSGNLLDIVNIEMYQEELKEIHTIMRGCIRTGGTADRQQGSGCRT